MKLLNLVAANTQYVHSCYFRLKTGCVCIMEEEDMFEEETESVEVVRTDSTDRQPHLDQSLDDFVEGSFSKKPSTSTDAATKVEEITKHKSKKRKAVESVESEDSEEGSVCTICFEDWSNFGDHRISSLKCGHFFGYR